MAGNAACSGSRIAASLDWSLAAQHKSRLAAAFLEIRMVRRNIHVPFQTFCPEKAHGYCVVFYWRSSTPLQDLPQPSRL
jgi:hypothetical protein